MVEAGPDTGGHIDIDAHAIVFQTVGGSGERQHVARREERTETSLLAMIRLQDGTEIPCVVKDVSKSGAKLGIPRGCTLPKTFMFMINGRDLNYLVTLEWQRDRYAGVRIERVAKLPVTVGSG